MSVTVVIYVLGVATCCHYSTHVHVLAPFWEGWNGWKTSAEDQMAGPGARARRERLADIHTQLRCTCTRSYQLPLYTRGRPRGPVTNLSQASLGRPSPRALKPRLRYKLNHGVVGGVYYNLYTRGARPGRVVCLRCSCEYVGRALARLAPPSGRAASRAWSRVARRVGGR